MTRSLELLAASDVTTRPVRWLWRDRVPLGKLTMFAGPGGQAKSLTSLAIAAGVTRGRLPGNLLEEPSRVLVMTAEDDPEDTVVPRLEAVEADRKLVQIADGREVINGERVP